MKKLFCFTALYAAFSAIGSEQPSTPIRATPIRESFGAPCAEKKAGSQPTGPQPIRHSFGSDEPDPWSGYFGSARYQVPKKSGEQGTPQVVQPQSNSDQANNK